MAEVKNQADLIAQATKKAVKARDKYVQAQIDQLVDVLETAENEVKASLLHYKNLGSLTKGKFLSQKSQKRLRGQIREITGELKKNHVGIYLTDVAPRCSVMGYGTLSQNTYGI